MGARMKVERLCVICNTLAEMNEENYICLKCCKHKIIDLGRAYTANKTDIKLIKNLIKLEDFLS